MDGVNQTSLSLLERVRSHGAAAWERWTFRHGPPVDSRCCHRGIGDDDASDLMQEFSAAMDRSCDRFRHHRAGDTFRGRLWTDLGTKKN